MVKMGVAGKKSRNKFPQAVEFAMCLLITSLVLQMLQVTTAATYNGLPEYAESRMWMEDNWKYDRDSNTNSEEAADSEYISTTSTLWKQLALAATTNWSITVTDTGLGAAVQIVYMGIPAKLDADISATITRPGATGVGNGGYSAYLSAGIPGEYVVTLAEGGTALGDPEYKVHVASPPSPFTSVVTPCTSPIDAGSPCIATVTANDAAGVLRSTPGKVCPFKVVIWDDKGDFYQPNSVTGPLKGDGVCNITFIPLRSRVYTARVSIGGKTLTTDGQFNITVVPSATAQANFVIESPDKLMDGTYTVGAVLFNIRSTNPSYKAIHGFTINAVSPNATFQRACWDIRTSVDCSFVINVTKPFLFAIDVLLDNTTKLASSIAAAQFAAGFIVGSNSRLSFAGNASDMVSSTDSPAFDISLMDDYGNLATNYSAGDLNTMLVIDLITPKTPSCYQHYVAVNAAGTDPGTYKATFKNLTCAGNYTVRGWYGYSSNVIEGSGMDLIVVAGPQDVAFSVVHSNGTMFTAGGSIGIVAFVGDVWGNPVLTAVVSFTLTSTDKSLSTNYTGVLNGDRFEATIGAGVTLAGVYDLDVAVGGTSLVKGQVNCTAGALDAPSSNFTIAVNFTAGVQNNFTLTLVDMYSNPIGKLRGPLLKTKAGAVHANGSSAVRVTVDGNESSLFLLSMGADVAGPYTIKIPYNMLVEGSYEVTEEIIVYPGPIDAWRSGITGPAMSGGVAGENFTVYIIPRDAFGNLLVPNAVDMALLQVKVTVTNRANPPVENPVTADPLALDADNGRYVSQFNATFSGTCKFQLTQTATKTTGSAEFNIRAAALSGALSTLTGMGLKGSVVNQPAIFFINAKDGFGNQMDDLGAAPVEFTARLCKTGAICVNATCTDDCYSAGRIAIRDRHIYGGMYTVIWSAPSVGKYSITLTSGTENITGSPVAPLTVITLAERGVPVAAQALVCNGLIFITWCPGYFGSVAGVKARFSVALADATQNFVASSGTALSIALDPVDPTAVTEIIDTNDGYYTIVYTITKIPDPATAAGGLKLVVNLGADPVTTATLNITPAWTSPEKSTIDPMFTALLVAGSSLKTTITPKDQYGNVQAYGPLYPATNDKFTFIAMRETNERIHGTVTWNDTTLVWDAAVKLTWSGIYYVAVLLNDMLLGTTGASATITVNPSTPTIENSILLQPWLPPIRSTEMAYFEVPALADRFGNQIVKDLSFTANATNTNDALAPLIPFLCALTNTTYALATCTYSFNKTGIYNVSYGASGLVAFTAIEVMPGAASDMSTVQGSATTNCTVGHLSVLTINCIDAHQNNCSQPATAFKAVLTLQSESGMVNTSAAPVVADIWSDPTGTYASYIVKEVGNWTLNVTLQDGRNITGSPWAVLCTHAFSTPKISFAYVVDPPRKLDNVGKVAMVAGTVVQLGVMILDANGNRQHPSVTGDTLNVLFEPEDATLTNTGVYLSAVTNNNDATFSFSVSASKVGTYAGGVLTPINYLLKVNCTTADEPTLVDVGIGGAPFTFSVLPGPISVLSTSVVLLASNPDTTGLTSIFRIITQDAYGNIAAYNQTLNVTAIIGKWEPPTTEDDLTGVPVAGDVPTPPATPPPKAYGRRLLQAAEAQNVFPAEGGGYTITPLVANNFDGTYTFTFSVTKAGAYNISVFIDSELVGTGSSTIENFMVGAGVPDFARLLPVSETLGKQGTPLPVKVAGNLTIAIADIFGNPVVIGKTSATTYSTNITAEMQIRKKQVNAYQIYTDMDTNITLTPWAVAAADGAITATYTPTSSGIVAFYMWFGDTVTGIKYLSAMTPVTGRILAGPVDDTSVRAYGGGTVAGLLSPCDDNKFCVAINNSVVIEVFDVNKNILEYEDLEAACANITTEYNATEGIMTMASSAVVSKSEESCTVFYSIADTNMSYVKVSFNISFGGKLITGAPWTVPIKRKNSEINVAKSFLWGDLGGVIEAGKTGYVTAQLVDKDGVWLAYSPMEGNEYVQLIIYNQTEGVVAPQLNTQDNGDGTFTLTYQTASTGTFGYQPVIGYNLRAFGPVFVIRVVASETVVATTSVSLISTNITVYRAGYDAVLIEVQPVDQFSNLQDYYFASPDMFQAKIQQPDGTIAYQTLDRRVSETQYGVPYHKWLLEYYPEQAPYKSSPMYIIYIMWSNGTAEEILPVPAIKIFSMPGPPAPNFIQVLGQGASKAIIGEPSSFLVELYDKLNNQVAKLDDILQYNVTMVVHSLTGIGDDDLINQKCVVNAAPPGAVCSYTVYDAGTYAIDIWANFQLQLQQSVTAQEPAIFASNSRAFGDGVGTTDNPVVVGVQAEFMIEAFDSLNYSCNADSLSNVTTTFDVAGYNLLSTGVIHPAPGYPLRLPGTNRVLVRYTVYKSGRYVVNVRRSGAHILGSPYYVTVHPGEISSMSTVDDNTLANCTSGESHSVTVTARDMQGNIRTHMEDSLTIIKTVRYQNESVMDTMKSLGAGVYTWNFTCLTAGTPDMPGSAEISVYSGRAKVWEGMIAVTPGPPNPRQFIVGAFDVVSAGEVGMTTVVAADSAGNPLWDGGLPIAVYLSSKDANTSASGEDWNNGTYTFTWMMTKSGQYTVVVQYNSTDFYREPVWVFPGPPDAKSTSVMFDGTIGYTAGVEGTLWIQFFDAYQNNITADVLIPTNLTFTSLSADAEARRAMFMAKEIVFTGYKYTVTFRPLYAGALKLHLKIGDGLVLQNGEPYTTQVIAGPPVASRIYAWGGGWTSGGVVGESAMFFLRLRDSMDNLIETEPPAPLVVTFTPAVATDSIQTYMSMGLMMIAYVPTAAAPEFTISLTYDGVPAITSGLLMVNGTTGNYSAARSVVTTADGVEIDNQVVVYSIAGESISFMIQARDTMGVPITSPPADSPRVPVYKVRITSTPTQVVEADPSTFQATFELSSNEARDYTVVVQSSDGTKELPNSGFTVKFLPGPSSPPNSVITTPEGEPFDPTKPLVAGHHFELMATAKDAFDNVQVYSMQNADSFVATLTAGTTTQAVGVSISFQSTYKISLQVPVVAGAGTLIVTMNGAQVQSYGILVIASMLYLRGTEITPWYLDPMIAGVEAYFDIIPVDAYQNVINSVNATQQIFTALAMKVPGMMDPLTLATSPDTYNFIEVCTLEPGMLSQGLHATVMPKKVGSYIVVAASSAGRIGGDTVNGVIELATVDILPGDVDITRSFATVELSYLAGQTITFRLTGLDSYNNLVPALPTVSTEPYYNVMVTPGVCSQSELEMWKMTTNSTENCPPAYTCDVMFTPHGYGDLNITMTWDGINALEHKVEIMSRGAPTILTALLDDTAGSILVTFDGVSDGGLRSMRGMRDGPERCEVLLDNITYHKLGTGPACGFKDASTMYIQLGYDATIMPAGSPSPDFITLATEGVFAQHETSLPAAGSVMLRPPNKHPPLVAILSGPTIVGACDAFHLDASASYGSGGRPMAFSYHVKGTGDLYKLADLGAILESLPNDTMVVNIPPGSLEANYVYTFVVVVVNFLGKRATASVTISVSATPVPILHIPGSAEIQTFSRGQIVSLEAEVAIPGTQVYDLESGTCETTNTKVNSTATQMIFGWTQIAGPYANLVVMGSTGQRLNIPGNQLVVGQVYTFAVTVSMLGYPTQFSTAQASVQVKSSPLMAFIKGGNRAVNASEDLILEAIAYDPDDLVDEFGNSFPFNFVWSCDTPITIPESLLYVYTEHNFGSMIRIPANTLVNGTTYNYTVIVTKEGAPEPAMAFAEIMPMDDKVSMNCEIANSADLHLGVYASSQLTIACTAGFESYNWSMYSSGDQRLLWELDPSIVIEGSIKIPPYQLLDARTYKITCEGRSSMGKSGTASVTFTTTMNPSGGTATLTQRSKKNAAGKTVYSVVAHGWMAGTGGGLLQYEFRYTYKKGKQLKEFIIQPLSTSNSVKDFVLLGGQVTIHVYVCDSGTPRVHSNDAPPGAKFSLPTFKVSGKGRRSLLSDSFTNSYFLIANEGNYFNSLTAMELLGTQKLNSQSGSCMASNRNFVQKMLDTVLLNGPQVPAATSTGGQSEGPGAAFALKQACVLSKLIGRAGNANNFTVLEGLWEIFSRDLRLVADFGLNVGSVKGQPYDPCFYDAGNAFMQAVKSRCYKYREKKVEKNSPDQVELVDRMSVIPNLIARIVVNDVGFKGPTTIKRKQYTAAAMKFAMSADIYDGPNKASGTLLNLQFDVTSIKPGGIPIGVAMSCFANSPLSEKTLGLVKELLPVKSLTSVCEVSFTGHTDGDWGETTIRGSWQELSKLSKKDSYVPLMVDDGVPMLGALRNVLASYDTVEFDFVRAFSRIILVKVKGTNFTTAPAPPPPPVLVTTPPAAPGGAGAANTTKLAYGYRNRHPIQMTRVAGASNLKKLKTKKTQQSSVSRSWRYDESRPQTMRPSGKKQSSRKVASQNRSRSYAARFWSRFVGRS